MPDAVSIKPHSAVTPISSYAMWLFHEASGAAAVDAGGALGNQTINGTTASIWTNRGWFTSAGDHQVQIASAAAQAFGNPGTLKGVGGLLFFADFLAASSPNSAPNYLMMYGRPGGSGQHRWGLTIETNGRFQSQHIDTGATIKSANTGDAGDLCDGARHSVAAFLDCVNFVMSVYVDGAQDGSGQALNSERIGASDTRGFGFLANITSDSPSYNGNFGADFGGSAGGQLSRMGIMRFEYDASAYVAAMVAGLAEYQWQLPWAFDGR